MLTVLLVCRICIGSFFGVIFIEIFSSSFTVAYKRDNDWELLLSIYSAHIKILA